MTCHESQPDRQEALREAPLPNDLRDCQRRLKKLQTWRVKMLHPAEVTSL